MREQNKKEAGIVRLLFSFLGSLMGVKGCSPCTRPCLQGVVCYTQQTLKESVRSIAARWSARLLASFGVVGEI